MFRFITDNKAGSSKKTKLTQDDESFLRAILTGRGLTTTMPSSTTEISNAALLAALLKAQGIEPSTPANNIREQLQLAVSFIDEIFLILLKNIVILHESILNLHKTK